MCEIGLGGHLRRGIRFLESRYSGTYSAANTYFRLRNILVVGTYTPDHSRFQRLADRAEEIVSFLAAFAVA